MSIMIPLELHPVVIVPDRYGGSYSHGQWLAVASANDPHGKRPRIDWALNEGPHGGDIDAQIFWADPPDWIAAGSTPEDALRSLFAKNGYDEESIAKFFGGVLKSLPT